MEEETLRSNLKGTSEKPPPPPAVDEKAALISNVPPQVRHIFGI